MIRFLPFLRAFAACLVLGSLSACGGGAWSRAFTAPAVIVSYDDLGPSSRLQQTLGPRGNDPRVRVHHGATQAGKSPRQLNAHQALILLRRNERALPQTPENAPLRQRMQAAYSRIYHLYRTRRDAVQAVPPFTGRGAMGRMQVLPPMPPTL